MDVTVEPSDTMPGYYSLENILEQNADYNVIFGERGNGKTYSVLKHGLEQYVKSGYHNQLAIIRRWKEDLVGKRAFQMFAALNANGEVKAVTDGEWEFITYTDGKWFLAREDKKLNKAFKAKEPFAFAFALNDMEHDKSISFPYVTNILFDEFITRRYYLPDEFIIFMNVLSTIIRQRDNVRIFMCGNTVDKYSPYFSEMGLHKASSQKQGTIDLYQYGKKSELKVAVEYCANTQTEKASNKYFAFDNENLQMITSGKWELELYPHLRTKFDRRDILFTYFIEWCGKYLQCEIVKHDDEFFTYVHEKHGELKNPDTDVVYSLNHSEKRNYHKRLLGTGSKMEKRIAWFYAVEKVFFQNNECGEIVKNYLNESMQSQFAKVIRK